MSERGCLITGSTDDGLTSVGKGRRLNRQSSCGRGEARRGSQDLSERSAIAEQSLYTHLGAGRKAAAACRSQLRRIGSNV